MTHPLTDEMCETLSRQPWLGFDSPVEGTIHDMRVAYDLAIEHVYVIWNQLCEEVERDSTLCRRFSRELNKMRPQQEITE